MRVPGRIVLASAKPITTEMIEMTTVYARLLMPTRPSRRMSPMPATPTTSDVNTSGTTVISSSRRNSWPIGSAICVTVQMSAGASAPSAIRAAPPAPAPAVRPRRIRT